LKFPTTPTSIYSPTSKNQATQYHSQADMGKNKKIKQSKAEYKAELAELNKNGGNSALPKKAFFRQRAHANPFSDHALI
jgi:hypothetical protein